MNAPQGQTVIAVGNCPKCLVGIMERDFTCCGILWAICCFPCGLLCLFSQRKLRCTHCKNEDV